MARNFNDGYYEVRIREWEQERIPQVVSFGQTQWIGTVALTVLVVLWSFDGFRDWRHWLAAVSAGYLVLKLFVFLHEINENVRFVRHKLEAQRIAHERLADQFRRYQRPDAVSVFDYVDALDKEWSD